ncbi:hypothetical protein [Bailinhaonella thermotolerans]|uniref:Uncharacterized protein n=1 Tax=Bailinhaonella thermotolerans TaxID=1070861 RepID=A0A3A4ASS1_9ACTN|nr:hypothetical protein [Bailinhaonella thermotolerans]RJL31629.1 hypothetical protein D5H75_18105 [Bailinhaonella thermotolerans]
MDTESPICLSDLVPALRWSHPAQIAEALADPRLPAGWWMSVSLPRVTTTTGVEWLCDRLARLAAAQWDHLPLNYIVPALMVADLEPAMSGWPAPVREAVSGNVGSWDGLRRLTPADLRRWSHPTPADPAAVIVSVLREVFTRVSAVRGPRENTGPFRQVSRNATGPQPVVRRDVTGPQPAVRRDATGPQPVVHGSHTGPQPVVRDPGARPEAPLSTPASTGLVDLVDRAFRGWDQLEHTVAVERLFASEPVSLRALAPRLGVDRERLRRAQRSAEERVIRWLRSPEAAPLTRHLFALTERLGVAATEEQLIAADAAHPTIVPTLRTALWRVLVALMPDRRMYDGWLIVGDPRALRERTRQLLSTRQPGADVIELLGQIGIRPHSARQWLSTIPELPAEPSPGAAASSTGAATGGSSSPSSSSLPSRKPGASGLGRRDDGNGAARPPEPRASVQESPRCFLAPDHRWWHRIDVTVDHLRGGPVSVPDGYAAHHGLRPGSVLSVTGPGGNAIVLVWRDHPAFDSVQPLLRLLNAEPGDHVFVAMKDHRLDVHRLPGLAHLNGNGPTPLARALRLVGHTAPATFDEAVRLIARRIGDNENDADRERLFTRLRHRGDLDILAHLSAESRVGQPLAP